ncbi:MAG: cytochrome c5 family protein [Gammaproteobacteria bacterium]|nr:cytochrome c5 family protein [Gammaproteobacteria bacterium]
MSKHHLIAAAVLLLGAGAVQAKHLSEKNVAERIAPTAQVYVEGDNVPSAAPAAAKSSGPRTGEQIVAANCGACHLTGAAGAPKIGTADWAPRKAKGVDALLASAIKGLNAMPPKGMCMDCSDDELRAAIEHMIK